MGNSPGHYRTMMGREHKLFAVGHGFNPEQSGSALRWTQMFGKSGTADTSCLNSWQKQSVNLATTANISNISNFAVWPNHTQQKRHPPFRHGKSWQPTSC